MAGFTVPISTAVKRMNSSVSFFQPIVEAVVNSLEAHASKIDIVVNFLEENLVIDGEKYTFDSFSITDDGDGFTPDNIASFMTYMSEYKSSLGCKGVGRITWLKVFSSVNIKSYVNNKEIKISFSEDFSDKNISEEEIISSHPNQTRISFSGVQKKYSGNVNNIHIREFIEELKACIQNQLLLKLFLLHNNGKKFNITISNNKDNFFSEISNDTIGQLNVKDFLIHGEKNSFQFKCYYEFGKTKVFENKAYYCANGRTVLTNRRNNIVVEIPGDCSALFLVTSPYFDENVNDERNEFRISETRDLLNELSWNDITPRIQQEIDGIIFDKFPKIVDNNRAIISELKNEYPYLTSYIEKDNSKIKKRENIIDEAKKNFEREKKEVSNRFKRLLEENQIDTEEFDKIVSEMSEIASRELAEYVVYRQQILSALEFMNQHNEKSEKKIHNIFMRMRSESCIETNEVYDNNLWLFDDKYMTYVYAASDVQIQRYTEKLNEIAKELDIKYRPDLAVFFSNKENSKKDAVVIEFKSCGASLDEKSKAIWEINRNAKAIRDSIDNLERMYCYTVTKFDEKFKDNIESQDFSPLFTNGREKEVYYRYFNKIDAHCYYISLESLLADAKARNKLFLDIIRKK